MDLHNEYRSRIAKGDEEGHKPARNMNALIWDDELAEVAQM